MKTAILALILLLYFATNDVSAHPGRTDSSGGHTCRTNCESWGLGKGEYHYHGGGGSSAGSSTGDSYTAPVQEAVSLPTKIPTRVPTKSPTLTVTVALFPTAIPTPTREPTKKVQPLKSSIKPQQQQGFFDWLFSLFRMR
jgi:hypothetical protein